MDKGLTFLDDPGVNSDSIWTRTFILGCLDKIKRHLLKAPGCGGLAGTKQGHNFSFTVSSSKVFWVSSLCPQESQTASKAIGSLYYAFKRLQSPGLPPAQSPSSISHELSGFQDPTVSNTMGSFRTSLKLNGLAH
ncbi:hypothetical protein Pyn_27013 [Prunus yedoensis var. nudiflora]|uniref:Uncharacterized protein n=1 Tax=Prunus yedoensis var. nudiflora TaxID=2094558 RepID=A0A314UDH1_PRUYE|nr:hypothetical protein Pyn_27013 [Prunus yedoensis var. nudiflora]